MKLTRERIKYWKKQHKEVIHLKQGNVKKYFEESIALGGVSKISRRAICQECFGRRDK